MQGLREVVLILLMGAVEMVIEKKEKVLVLLGSGYALLNEPK